MTENFNIELKLSQDGQTITISYSSDELSKDDLADKAQAMYDKLLTDLVQIQNRQQLEIAKAN